MWPPTEFSKRLPQQWVYWILSLGLLISLTFGVLGQTQSGFSAQWNHFFLDAYMEHSASGESARHSIVVDIDDVSLAAGGQWPWPRYRMAELIEKINAAKPAAIGLDILFSEPDRTSLNVIQQSFKRDFGIDLDFVGSTPGLSDNDSYFGSVLARTNVVGARFFYFDHVSKAEAPIRTTFHIRGKTHLLALYDAPSVLDNTYAIASQLKYQGFINSQPDSDGMLRRVPLLINYTGVLYPHLALATYMRAHGIDSVVIDEDAHGPLLRVGDQSIPITKNGNALLRFNGNSALYPSISALDVLNGTFHADDIKGKIVFVGSSAAALNDLHSTIFDAQSPGLRIHSALIENIAENRFVRTPSWTPEWMMGICLIIGLLISWLYISQSDPLKLFAGSAALVALPLLISLPLFSTAAIFLSPAAPMLVAVILFTLFTTARFVIEKNQAHLWYRKLANAQQTTMESMAAVAETRDPETGAHIKRTQHYVKSIAEKLREVGYYSETLTTNYIDLLFISAPLHDIGKVGVPDHILLKPGKLDPEEFELMKLHAEYGKNIIQSAAQKIEGDNYLVIAGEIAWSHHERWNGNGYPRGLAGHDIPLSGRIMAVADVYDALISRRCYKHAFPHTLAMQMMRDERERIFDPVVLDAFLSIEETILDIAARYRDVSEDALSGRLIDSWPEQQSVRGQSRHSQRSASGMK